MRKVDQIMGLPISVDIPGCDQPEVFEGAFDRLRQIDTRFSPFKPDSEVSKFNDGELQALSHEFDTVKKACADWQEQTSGYFSADYKGDYDPSGYVKGWAIDQAGKAIAKQGYKTFCIGAGGDILASSDGSRDWRIGIQDPTDAAKILDVLSISKGAVATSGNYERGQHIYNPKTGKPAGHWLSVTVTGPDIVTADVLATATFAAGQQTLELMKKFPEYRFLGVARKVVGNNL